MNISPDGIRYVAMGHGLRVPLPFHLRWAPSYVCRAYQRRWQAVQMLSFAASAVLLAIYLKSWVGVVLVAALPGLSRFAWRYPILVDAPAFTLALGAAVAVQHGNVWAGVALALASGACKETAPVFAAVWAWNPILLAGLAAPALRMLWKPGPEPSADVPAMPVKALKWRRDPRWFDPALMVLPWGPLLAALWAPTWQLAAAITVAYGQLAVLVVCGLPVFGRHDTNRLVQWAAPVMAAAALTVIPDTWLLPAVVVAWFSPWSRP